MNPTCDTIDNEDVKRMMDAEFPQYLPPPPATITYVRMVVVRTKQHLRGYPRWKTLPASSHYTGPSCVHTLNMVCQSVRQTSWQISIIQNEFKEKPQRWYLVFVTSPTKRGCSCLHSLQQVRLWADLITAFMVFTDRLVVDPNLVILPPTRRSQKRHSYKVHQGTTYRRRGGSAFSMRVMQHWNKLPASVVMVPSVNVFKNMLETVWTEVIIISPTD